MKHRGRLAPIAIALALAVLAAACAPAADLVKNLSSGSGDAPSLGGELRSPAAKVAGAPPKPAEAPAPSGLALEAAQPGGARPQTRPGQPEPPSLLDRMIIRTAEVNLSVSDVQFAIQEVERIATVAGGMVFSSSFSRSGERAQATVTIRVPPDERTFQQTLERLRAIEGAKVEQQTIKGEDVTEQYADLEAQIRNLLRTEQRLLALLDRAQRIEDVLALERELSNIRNQAERLEGRKRLLERRADLATITVTLREAPGGVRPVLDWDPVRVATQALAALLNATQGLVTVLIWLVIWSPVYVGAILGFLALRRRLVRPKPATQP